MKVGVFHPGTQHSWQTALALQQLDRLAWFATSLFYKPGTWPYVLEDWAPGALGERLRREFQRLAKPDLDPALVHTAGAYEWTERIAVRMGMLRLAGRLDRLGNRRFVHAIAGSIRASDELALWGYNGSSRSTFELAKPLGRTCVLDRTIGDARAYNAAMDTIAERYGDWFLPDQHRLSLASIDDDEREYALADHILVGSDYVARTLEDHARDKSILSKVRVLGYCFDDALFANLPPPEPRAGPVRFLFIGLVAPRKGIHHVLEAIAQLPASEATLSVVGEPLIPARMLESYADRIDFRRAVPRSEVPALMASHDVLLLPSYHEGAAITAYEAMAAGLGLIQSDRTAIVATPQSGVVLDRIDTECLLAAMRKPIEDRMLLAEWRAAARRESRKYNFAAYRDRIENFLIEAGI